MALQERLQKDLEAAMRRRDTVHTNVLRMLKAAIRNAEIDHQRKLDDAAVLVVLDKAARQRRESIAAYRQGGREDLVAAEASELGIIEGYLPRQLDEAEIRAAVDQAIVELGAQGPADMGRVIKVVLDRLRGQADGRLVNTVVREALAALKV